MKWLLLGVLQPESFNVLWGTGSSNKAQPIAADVCEVRKVCKVSEIVSSAGFAWASAGNEELQDW